MAVTQFTATRRRAAKHRRFGGRKTANRGTRYRCKAFRNGTLQNSDSRFVGSEKARLRNVCERCEVAQKTPQTLPFSATHFVAQIVDCW